MSRLTLKPGRIVRVTPFLPQERGPYIARIVGRDAFHTKYQVGVRYCGWNEYHFASGGSWAFPGQVETIDDGDVPFVAAFCDFDGVTIMLYPPGTPGVRPGWQHIETCFDMFDGARPADPRGNPRWGTAQRMFRRHKIRPRPGTAQTADVWDFDVAADGGYLETIPASLKEI